jgi:hypothetical protein
MGSGAEGMDKAASAGSGSTELSQADRDFNAALGFSG